MTKIGFPLAALLALAACGESEPKPSFTGTDITGANYGRDFALSDPDGNRFCVVQL